MASITEKAKESVKETLVGVDEDQPQDDPKASAQTKATFNENAIEDENGDKYLGMEEFVNAVAPMGEDYVSITSFVVVCTSLCTRTAQYSTEEKYSVFL
jgi:solute carrier family 25 (mitochondrial aspartate/glutamate transporter), member 12/13